MTIPGMLLEKRGRLSANRRLTEQYLKEIRPIPPSRIAAAVTSGSTSLNELEIKPVFQVAPGSKGLKDHQEDRTTGWRSGIPAGSSGSNREDEVEGNG